MTERIVVGVDGSEAANLATRWAADEAAMRGAELELVCAWRFPMFVGSGYGAVAITDQMVKDLITEAESRVAAAAEVARAVAPELSIGTTAAEGQPAEVLMERSKTASLLVVGSRGLGGFRELLLGSVSQQCAHHSSCPVVIVRHAATG
jgi:nucleotide-binding universal stress UspA family protein